MDKDQFTVSFVYESDQLKGSAKILLERENDQVIHLAGNIRFDNTQEELLEAGWIVEQERCIKPVLDTETDHVDWVDADSEEEESELATLIGRAIEEYIK